MSIVYPPVGGTPTGVEGPPPMRYGPSGWVRTLGAAPDLTVAPYEELAATFTSGIEPGASAAAREIARRVIALASNT